LIISNLNTRSLPSQLGLADFKPVAQAQRRWTKLFRRKSNRRRAVRIALVGGNVVVLAIVVGVIIQSPHQGAAETPKLLSNSVTPQTPVADPLDQVSSAVIAETVARLGSMPETTAVTNQADSETAELSMAPATNSVVTKPQVVATNYASNKDIKTYTTVAGDSITSIAAKFGITSDSIRWSNNITGDTVGAGVKLVIPPVSGIVYTVKPGDTAASLAQKYKADPAKITAYNDAEISGLTPGEQIIIPDGTLASAVAANASINTGTSFGWGGAASYGSNGYDVGYCTWWVAKLRAAAGDPLPTNLGNAATWAIQAARFGIPTGTTPQVGAAVVTKTSGEGHVAYVTAVNSDGTITISEMNRDGWDRTDTATIPASGYNYIY
jgi:surface antigen/LysM repeat protein